MEIVSGLSLRYLRLENASSPMLVTHLLQYACADSNALPPALSAWQYAISQRLAQLPTLRQRLVESPLQLANPLWLDDPHMDLNYHLRGVNLSETTTDNPQDLRSAPQNPDAFQVGLERLIANRLANPLDRGSPLWRLDIVSSHESKQFAILATVHLALAYRLPTSLLDVLFPEDNLVLACQHHTTTPASAQQWMQWIPESIPSRNDFVKFARGDWFELPQQMRSVSQLVLGRWTKKKVARALVEKSALPPNLKAAPESLFNQPNNTSVSVAQVNITAHDARQILRSFKQVELRDLVYTLVSRSLQLLLEELDHQHKDELVALVQPIAINSVSLDSGKKSKKGPINSQLQLLRLPTLGTDLLEQLQSVLERQTIANDFSELCNHHNGLEMLPSSVLSLLFSTYQRFGLRHFHKPLCNLMITERAANSKLQSINDYHQTRQAISTSLMPNLGLHVAFFNSAIGACISFTTNPSSIDAAHLAKIFEQCWQDLKRYCQKSDRSAL